METHFDEQALRQYAAGGVRPDVEEHLAKCDECAERLERLVRQAAADAKTWDLVPSQAEDSSEQMGDLDALAARYAQEDEEARRILEPLLEGDAGSMRVVWANLPRRREFRTGGVARALIQLAHDTCEAAPHEARQLADEARMIAELLPDNYYPASLVYELRGDAWKEQANALKYLAEFREADEALTRAARAYRHLLMPESWLGTIHYIRAGLLREQQRYDEGLREARTAKRIFEHDGDRDRFIDACLVEANIVWQAGDARTAREILQPIYESLDEKTDAKRRAYFANSLGNYCIDSREFGFASGFFLGAHQIWQELGIEAEGISTRWSLAYLTLVAGNASDALRRLDVVRADALRLGLSADAARMQLDRIEALILLGRSSEVAPICRELLTYFSGKEMSVGSRMAAAYLRETQRRGALSVERVRYVRRFLQRLQEQPTLLFIAPE